VSKYVLDASAILALLNDEPGAQRVSEILPESIVGAVNMSEAAAKLISAGMNLSDATNSIELLGLEIVPFDAALAYKAASLATAGRKLGLSLGDRACLALAMAFDRTVVTADHMWPKLKLPVRIDIIR
jgi:PIN domain nuclease of toxin-antitoxin system